MDDRLDTPPLDGWPDDPGVTYDPGRTLTASTSSEQPSTPEVEPLTPPLATWSILPPNAEPVAAPPGRPTYRLERLAGSGGFGEVWQAVQVSLDRVVALKRPLRSSPPPRESSPATARLGTHLFRQEALVTAQLDHPSIVPVHDIGVGEDGEPVLTMKFVRGRLWKELVEELVRDSSDAFLARHLPILVSVAQATAYAHAHGVVHRDIKPGQVMVGEFGEVFLTDWGLAVRLSPQPSDPPGGAALTASSLAGTAAYMAPEQTGGPLEKIGPWTDVYLLGGTLYTLLTGKPPHPGTTTATAFRLARDGEVIPIREAAGEREVPPALAALAQRCLAADPAQRPASAREVVHELQEYLSGAGKRREALALASEGDRRLAEGATSYRELADLLSMLGQSRALWPTNPALDALVDRALEAWTNAALAAGDLALARVQAERVHDSQHRSALLQLVASAERRHGRERRQRRWALGTAAALLVTLGAGALIHARSMAAARDRAEHALAAEAKAHAQVIDLLNFLLGDLREGLQPIGRLSLLEKVADKAFEQLRAFPPGQMPDAALAQRARALDTLGEVLATRGSETNAAAAWREALAIREGLATRDPGDPDRQRDLASSLLAAARATRSEGKLTEAIAQVKRSLEVRDRLLLRPGGDANVWERERASDRHVLADLLEASGDEPGALALHRAGLAILEACVAQNGNDAEARRDRAVARSRVGDCLADQGDSRAALVEYRAYAAEIDALLARDPHHAGLIRELAVAHNSIGWALRSTGDLRGSLVELRTQGELMTRLVERDPTNAAWRLDLAQCRAATGQVLTALGQKTEALAELEAAATEMERLAAGDPNNRDARRDAAVARAMVAHALLQAGRAAEAARTIATPLATIEALAAADPANASWQSTLAKLRGWQAEIASRSPRGR